jgi:HEAT repeats
MTSKLILFTPCALVAAAGFALAQPVPVPEPDVRPLIDAVAINVDAIRDSARIAQKMAQEAGSHDEMLAKMMALAQDAALIKIDPVRIDIDKMELARLKMQTDVIRAKEIKGMGKPKWGRSCGDGSIDSAEEADAVYDCGRQALDNAAWDEALQSFSRVAAAKLGARAAGAVYWRAYSQNRLGQRAEALATLGELKSAYPSSGWAGEANALEVEIRQSSGQRVTTDGGDEDLTLLALNGVANSDADDAVPLIEGVLKSAKSPRVKERALFVLAQSNKPAARDVVIRVAKGGSNPDLQLKAVQFVGMFRSTDGIRVLSEVYGSTQDQTVRRAILRSYMMANAREPLLAAARQETSPELRLEAVRQLGNMKAGAELAELYAKETAADVKKQILRGLAIAAQYDKLLALAQSETNPELRRTAIRSLGLNRDAPTGTMLTQLYAKEQAPEVREAVLDALYTQGNAAALVTLARQEKDPALRLTIVRRLSTMTRSPEAKAYMLELLK